MGGIDPSRWWDGDPMVREAVKTRINARFGRMGNEKDDELYKGRTF